MTKLIPNEFIKAQSYGILSTHSLSESGFPFGSVTPYITTDAGHIAIFISHLAEHTHNIQANQKVSLTIFDPSDANNPNAGPRITCLANATPAEAENEVSLREQYLQQFPDSTIIMELPGFHFYILKLVKIRLVAGFGKVQWLTPKQLSL